MSSSDKILIVEDSDATVLFLKQILEDHGYRYSVARNGKDALAALSEVRPSLVLLDIMMPKKSGVLVLRQMKTAPEYKDIPVIVVTGTGQITGVDMHTGAEDEKESYKDDFNRAMGQELRDKILGQGPDGFIDKPIDPGLLVEKIQALMP